MTERKKEVFWCSRVLVRLNSKRRTTTLKHYNTVLLRKKKNKEQGMEKGE